jgi:glyoxylase-like metal-dependent hydrolase (beta-lactamase superfamily II)/ferredoxin
MASLERRHPDNVEGELFVDRSCIDCAACRWVAPGIFTAADDHSRVARQPETVEERRRALLALVACPTGSIGTVHKADLTEARAAFPERVEEPVYYAGYHSRDSYGAASWLIVRREGNVLIDSPRFARALVERIEALGGVSLMFLTHRDDVADHKKWQRRFGCRRVMHTDDLDRETREVEIPLEGSDPIVLDGDLTFLPVPGHTRGSTVLLYGERFLFSGDHLAYRPELGHPAAFRSVCWYSWREQIASMERLAKHRFEWILPGHGDPCRFPPEEMAKQMERCLSWMRNR